MMGDWALGYQLIPLPLPSSTLQTRTEYTIREQRPYGGSDDPYEEKDEQQRLPNVTAAALLGGRRYNSGRCWLIRSRCTIGSRFRSRSGIGYGRGPSCDRRQGPSMRAHAHGLHRVTRRSLPAHREIVQPLREIVVIEKGAGIGAGTERGQVRDLLHSILRIDGSERRCLGDDGAPAAPAARWAWTARPPSGRGGRGGNSAAASHSSVSASGVPQSTQSVRLVSFQAPQPWHSVTDRPPGSAQRSIPSVRRV